jgi:hypothetical protein
VVVGAGPAVVERRIVVGKLVAVVVGPGTHRSGSATGKTPATEEADDINGFDSWRPAVCGRAFALGRGAHEVLEAMSSTSACLCKEQSSGTT